MSRTFVTLALLLALALPAPAQTFDGAYAGVDVSYVRGTPSLFFTLQPPSRPVRIRDVLRLDGLEYGGFAGYRRAFDNQVVLGAELGANLGSVEGSRTTVTGAAPAGLDTRLKREGELALSLRAGYAVTPATLVYGIGGVQAARFDLRAEAPDGGFEARRRSTRTGWHVGVGAERALGSNLSIRAEYRYQRFEAFGVTSGPVTVRARPDESSFRFGAIWRF